MKKKTLLQILSLSFISVLVMFIFGIVAVNINAKAMMKERLAEETELACSLVQTEEDFSGFARYSNDDAFRVTIMDLDGNVLFESDTKSPLENHIDREEVKNALNGFQNALKNVKAAKGSSKITVKKGMPTAIVNQKIYTYWEKTSTPFKIKYRDVRGDHIEGQTIIFKINKKTYKKKTDSTGLASINIKLNKGVYTLQIYSYNTAVYKKSSNTYTIVVKSKNTYKNNGFWLFGSDMKNVNLKTAAKYGVNNIFLNFYAVELYGKSAVADFATEARSLGINVHIWMQAFYNGGWISPVNKDGSYKYSLFNSIIKEAKSYASIDGIAGIHFDYLRFPGTAYKYSTGTKAINYFTQKICTELHNMNPDLILSAAVMPEPSSMKYYYGQDIPTISKYLDVLVPMVYKGNYHQGSSWIRSITSTFVSQSNGADVWTGLQGYVSDSNVQRLSASNLKKDAVYANEGGAMGVIVFRYSLFNYFDFDSI